MRKRPVNIVQTAGDEARRRKYAYLVALLRIVLYHGRLALRSGEQASGIDKWSSWFEGSTSEVGCSVGLNQ